MRTRYSQRISVSCSVVFAGDDGVGEGRILDLSLPGCLLEGADTLKTGDYVQLRIFLPDLQTPLHIPLAAVRWVDGFKVGLEFIRTSRQEQKRLEQFVHGRMELLGSGVYWNEGIVVIGEIDKRVPLPSVVNR
jgi:hypothetical protein